MPIQVNEKDIVVVADPVTAQEILTLLSAAGLKRECITFGGLDYMKTICQVKRDLIIVDENFADLDDIISLLKTICESHPGEPVILMADDPDPWRKLVLSTDRPLVSAIWRKKTRPETLLGMARRLTGNYERFRLP